MAPAQALEADIGIMHTMDETGDSQIRWHRHNSAEVEMARDAFDSMKGKGYAAFSMTANGEKGEVIREFDPAAEKIIFAPPMRGG